MSPEQCEEPRFLVTRSWDEIKEAEKLEVETFPTLRQ